MELWGLPLHSSFSERGYSMKSISIEYRGKSYGLVFDLNVMEQIQDEYGTIEEWGKLTEPDDGEPNVKALIFGVWAMVNEGIDIANDENGAKEPFVTKKQVGRMLTEVGLETASKAAKDAVVESTEDDSKNA